MSSTGALVALLLSLQGGPAAGGAAAPIVEGVVRSSRGEAPLAYAHVRVIGGGISDWTDQEGRYRLDGLERGRWRIRVAHPGHDSLDLEVFAPGDRDLALDITLGARPGPAPAPLADFEPFQVAYTLPALLNSGEVTARIQQQYPPDLVERGIGGEAVLRLWLDEAGQVVRGLLSASSGQPALDSMALALADQMRFRPAKNRDQAVRVIVRIPVVFNVPASSEPPPDRSR